MEVHKIYVNVGGTCSIHLHFNRINSFIVDSGKLLIKQFKDSGLVDETILEAGDLIECYPLEKHQFIALTDVVAWEVYYPVGCIPEDIKRFSEGFLDTNIK